jgi:hypothetical protein
MKKIDQQLRDALASCGLSLNQVSVQSGIAYPPLYRFVHGTPEQGARDLRLATAAKLAAFLGMELTTPKMPVSAGTPTQAKPSVASGGKRKRASGRARKGGSKA